MNKNNYKNKVVKILAQSIEIDWKMPYQIKKIKPTLGTGFIINKKGYILTCSHVLDKTKEIYIELPKNGSKKMRCDILGFCPDLDIGMIYCSELEDFDYFEIGNSDKVNSGDEVYTIGFPLGQETIKITKGIVSGRHESQLQIDAPLNPGNSGGPLIKNGKVIGINVSGIDESQNINYSVPINQVKLISHELKKKRHLIHRPFLGFLYDDTNKATLEFTETTCPSGIHISSVFNNSPIVRAGVHQNTILCSFDSSKIDNHGMVKSVYGNGKMILLDLINRIPNNDSVPIEYWRHGKFYKRNLKFSRYLKPIRKVFPLFEDFEYIIFGGMIVTQLTINFLKSLIESLDEDFKSKLGLLKLIRYADIRNSKEPRLIITKIFPNSNLGLNGVITENSVLKKINGRIVQTITDYKKALLMPKKRKGKYFMTIQTEEDDFSTLDLYETLKEEAKLINDYKYPIDDIIKKLVQKIKK